LILIGSSAEEESAQEIAKIKQIIPLILDLNLPILTISLSEQILKANPEQKISVLLNNLSLNKRQQKKIC